MRTSRSGSSTRSTAGASSRPRASSTWTTTASSTSSRATPGTRGPPGSRPTSATWHGQGTYYNDFATLPLDVNGDGNTDFVDMLLLRPGRRLGREPGQARRAWTYHEVDQPGPSEAAWAVDLSGDGIPDILPNTVNVGRLVRGRQEGRWQGLRSEEARLRQAGGRARRRLGRRQRRRPRRPAHAQGLVRGPGGPAHDTWAWHPEWNLGATGIQILARDVDGDGLSDVVYGMGHDYGLYWLQPGERHRRRADLDQAGDRQDDRVGPYPALGRHRRRRQGQRAGDRQAGLRPRGRAGRNRRLGHRLVRLRSRLPRNGSGTSSSRASPPRTPRRRRGERLALKDFPPGTAGTGLQITAIDIDRDGDIDLVCPGKSGLYLFENLRVSK